MQEDPATVLLISTHETKPNNLSFRILQKPNKQQTQQHKQTNMAILKQPESTGGGGRRIKLEGPPSKGTYLAVCFEIEERFGVTRKKFESEETEVVDLISFYFGFKQKDGTPGIVRSKPMKISGHEKSALVQFVRQWLGDAPPTGFDTDTLKGAGAQVTVALHMAGNGKTYANIASIGPVMEGLEKSVPDADRFMQYLEPLGGSPSKDDDDSIPL